MFITLACCTLILIALAHAPKSRGGYLSMRSRTHAHWKSSQGQIGPQQTMAQICANKTYINCPDGRGGKTTGRHSSGSETQTIHRNKYVNKDKNSKLYQNETANTKTLNPSDNVLRTESGYVPGSLELFDATLYRRALNVLDEITVVTRPGGKAVSHSNQRIATKNKGKFRPPDPKPATGYLTICSSEQHKDATLVLFTSMYHDVHKQFIFTNVLINYSLLGSKVLPIMYITDKDIVTKSGYLIYRACQLGWTVAAAPQRTAFGFPLLPAMFEYAQRTFQVSDFAFSFARSLSLSLAHLH